MKKIIGVFAMLISGFHASAVEVESIKSIISNVTVYSQGAQVFRKANYSVKSGITKIVIDGVSKGIDANSLQVKASGNVVILDSKYSMYYPKPEEVNVESLPAKVRQDIKILEDSLRDLGYDMQSIQDEIDVLNATKTILANNGAMRGQGKVNDSINLLKQAIDYYTVKMNEINSKLSVLNRKKQEKSQIQQKMNDRLTKLKNFSNQNKSTVDPNAPIPRITITVQAAAATTGKIDLSYLVSQAGWVPLYDLRSEIELQSKRLSKHRGELGRC